MHSYYWSIILKIEMTNIFIANLDFGITSEDLKATFSQFGEVSYAHVVYDSKTKKSKGYGYVEMEEVKEAINAIDALNGLDVNGRELDVKIAIPKDKRPKKTEKSPAQPAPRSASKETSKEKPKRVMRPRRRRNKED